MMKTQTKRYHEFDALRGFAMVLGIVLHGLLSFTFLPIWPAQDIHQNTSVYGFFQHAIHGFRMPVFFLISGFFTAMMWRKRGSKGLVVHRGKRILFPLIVGTIVMWPLMIGLVQWGTIAKEQRQDNQGSSGPDIWTLTRQGDLEGLQALIGEGADVNARDSFGVSSLEWAAMYGHAEAIALLVAEGADVNGRNPDGSTPLHAAAFVGRTQATESLVDLGANPALANNRGDTPLDAARVDMAIVRWLAGILQLPIDEESVVVGKRETAAFLERVGGASAIADEEIAEVATPESQRAGLATGEDQEGGNRQNPVWGRLLGIYLMGTFLPLFHHLWFLYYLLWLVGLFLVAAWVWGRCPGLRIPSRIIAMPWCLLWLIPLTLLPQFFMTQTFGVDTATGLFPWPPTLIYYAVFFGFGALCFGRPEFEEKAGRHWVVLFLMALPVLLIGLYLFSTQQGGLISHLLRSLCAVVYAWLMVFGMIGFFRRFFASENQRLRYLSDSCYWLYLAHLPLVIALQIWVSNWDVPSFPKFLLVCGLTFAVLIFVYEYAVRYTFVGTVLNGKKTRPAKAQLPELERAG